MLTEQQYDDICLYVFKIFQAQKLEIHERVMIWEAVGALLFAYDGNDDFMVVYDRMTKYLIDEKIKLMSVPHY